MKVERKSGRDPGLSTFHLQLSTIVNWIGDASIVLLGEASHGTHEFYSARAALTRELIERKGFQAVAIEGDWPDAFRVNQYIRGLMTGDGGQRTVGCAQTAAEVLSGFARFPEWMWRNTDVRDFIEWLRRHNETSGLAPGRPEPSAAHRPPSTGFRPLSAGVGFYGLDLYSLHSSMRTVLAYLDKVDPAAAAAARKSYGCFDHYGADTETYAWATHRQGGASCEDAVVGQLTALHLKRSEFLRIAPAEAYFDAEQNAQLVVNAERYYRTMFEGRISSWNLRDQHMADTTAALLDHLARQAWTDEPPTVHRAPARRAKLVVWAHNSHVGDARATEMGDRGEHTLGQLLRERFGSEVKLVGFTTYAGAVMAATDWGGQAEVKTVRPALEGSWEKHFHDRGQDFFFLPLQPAIANRQPEIGKTDRRLNRAIGVIYRPETERQSHYFYTTLASQFDAVLHFDRTTAVRPLPAPAVPPRTRGRRNLSIWYLVTSSVSAARGHVKGVRLLYTYSSLTPW